MPIPFMQDPLPIINQGEWHIPVVILVDTSGSMSGEPIAELNRGLIEFCRAIQNDSLAMGRAEVSIISFNSSVRTEMSFRPAVDYEAPTLTAGGLTAMNEAVEAALDAIEARKAEYRAQGVSYYRPWLFLLTDGAPTDDELEGEAKRRLRNAIESKKVKYIPMGIGAFADTQKLRSYYPEDADIAKPVLKARADNFKEAFSWLSNSIGVVSHSNPNTTSKVQSPPIPNTLTIEL